MLVVHSDHVDDGGDVPALFGRAVARPLGDDATLREVCAA